MFFSDHWQRRPLLRRDDGTGLADLLSLDDVDRILTTTSPRTPTFRLARGGHVIPRSAFTRRGTVGGQRLDDLPDPGRIMALFHDGATIALQGLHRWWPPVAALCRDLADVLTHPVQANAYVTPPGSRGLDVHHDTHDVIALQTEGHKHWVVHEPAVELPLPRQRWSSTDHAPGPCVMDTDLRPGDSLYLPRGTPHAAETVDTYSVHLTLGIRVVTLHQVLERALARAGDDVRFRRALSPGFAADPGTLRQELSDAVDQAGRWLADVDVDVLADETAEAFWTGRAPDLRHGLSQQVAPAPLEEHTAVRPRRGHRVLVRTVDDRLELVLGDRTLSLPVGVRPAVEQLLAGPVKVADLSDVVDAEGRFVLVRRLLREGLLLVDGVEDG